MPRKRSRVRRQPGRTVVAPSATPNARAVKRASAIEATNLGLRFALEMTALIVLGFAGYNASGNELLRWVLAIGAPLTAALVWGAFVSPKATMRLPDPSRLIIEVAFFAMATAALVSLGTVPSAMLYAALTSFSLWLMFALKQRGA